MFANPVLLTLQAQVLLQAQQLQELALGLQQIEMLIALRRLALPKGQSQKKPDGQQ